jgi:hypothetical protein
MASKTEYKITNFLTRLAAAELRLPVRVCPWSLLAAASEETNLASEVGAGVAAVERETQ